MKLRPIGVPFIWRHLLTCGDLSGIQAGGREAAAHVALIQIVLDGRERDEEPRNEDSEKAPGVGGDYRDNDCAHGSEKRSPELPMHRIPQTGGIVFAPHLIVQWPSLPDRVA